LLCLTQATVGKREKKSVVCFTHYDRKKNCIKFLVVSIEKERKISGERKAVAMVEIIYTQLK
jgi:hypothetical protein